VTSVAPDSSPVGTHDGGINVSLTVGRNEPDGRRRRAVAGAVGAVLLVVSGCASTTGTPAAHPPAPPPTGTTISGQVPVRVVALDGPFDPAGPLAATSLAALVRRMRAAQGGRALVCQPACWQDAGVPPASLLIALRYAWDSCYALRRIATGRTGHVLTLDVRVVSVCSDGGGAAARARDVLLAVPISALPHGSVTIRVRGALLTGELRAMGRTSVQL
jgi:hypothetical protein